MAVFDRPFVDSNTWTMRFGDSLEWTTGFYIGDSPVNPEYETATTTMSALVVEKATATNGNTSSGSTGVKHGGTTTTNAIAFAATLSTAATAAMLMF